MSRPPRKGVKGAGAAAGAPPVRKSGPKGGAPVKPPRLGWHSTKHYFFVLDRGKQKSCETADHGEALVYLSNYVLGVVDPGAIVLDPILRKALVDLKPAWIYKRLLGFWAAKRVRDIDERTCEAYVKYSRRDRGLPAVADVKSVSDSCARRELKMLFARTRAYVAKMRKGRVGAPYEIRGWMPKEGAPRDRFLFADEIHRFLLVALGRKIDPDAEDGWMRDPATGRFALEDGARRRRWEPVARLIMLGAYTGSRLEVMLAARWRPEPGCGFVDLDNGLFHRTDAEEPGAIKASPTVRVHRKLDLFLRACRRRDRGRGFDRVIHDGVGGEVGNIVKLWKEVRAAAGLDGEVIRHTLRKSCSTLLLADGVSEHEVARFIGVTVKNLLRHYAQVHPRITDWVADVLDHALTGRDREVSLEYSRGRRASSGV